MIQPNKKVVKNPLIVLMSTLVLLSGAAAALASSVTYKHRLLSYEDDRWVYSTSNDFGDFEWAVVKLKDNREFSVYHTSQRQGFFSANWSDHPVIAMQICLTDGFNGLSDCKVVNSDTSTIPEGRTIHDLSIKIKYSAKGRIFWSRFVIPSGSKSE